MITKLTIRNLRANTGRFAMTTFGVVLAVSFVVSAFVLSDGLRRTFADLSTDIVAGTDLEVRPVDNFGSTIALGSEQVEAVLAVDGVADAVGFVEAPENSVRPITPAGDEIPTAGPPQLAFSWSDRPGFSPLTIVEGEGPQPGQFVMDLGSADRHDFEVGETYTVITATGRHELELTGLTRFGSDNQTLGAVLMSMHSSEVDALFGTHGFESIAIGLTDAARADLGASQARVAAAVPDLEVVDQVTLEAETAAEFNTQIDIIRNILLGFAGVALLVSIFIIANTFAIVLQQRTREMGLLRLVGADASQLRRSAIGEAAAVGVIASGIGIPGGIGVAVGITALFSAIGLDLPAYDVVVSPQTIGIALTVGLGVTLLAAWWPTRVAAAVPPMTALRDGGVVGRRAGRTRIVAGATFTLLGAIGVILGLGSTATGSTIVFTALGALGFFAAVTALAPMIVGPVVAGFATVLDRLGMPGRLAVRNARRQAVRTATTATALMIGLAVVTMAFVVGESIKAQLSDTLDSTVSADYLLTDQASEAGFPTSVVDELVANPAFAAVSGFRVADMQVGDDIDEVTAARFSDVEALFDFDLVVGDYGRGSDSVVVSSDKAEATAISVGDVVPVTFENGATATLVVSGIFDDAAIVEQDWMVDVGVFDRAGLVTGESWVAFNAVADASAETVEAALLQVETRYPQGELETAAEFQDRLEGLIDQILSVLNVMIALAVFIALIGIANTLALSVSERTREIGLVRAVGMSQRGVRRMVRYESAVIATFGALLGVGIGIGLGWLTVTALPSSVTATLAVPAGRITTLVIVAAVAGVLAALLPARRAGRMNVLAAISR